MTRSLMAEPASRRASQSGNSPTTAARLARIVVVALPRLRRNWLLASAAFAACGNIGRDLDGITRPHFLCWPEFQPGGWSLPRRAGAVARHRCAAGRTY